jgi:hypothetical protein
VTVDSLTKDAIAALLKLAAKYKVRLFVVIALISLAIWLPGGARFEYVDFSPDRTYRVEFYSPKRYQRVLHPTMKMPGFVRLYRNTDNILLAESHVADFFSGDAQVFWLMETTGEVAVGRDIVFKDVPPVVLP